MESVTRMVERWWQKVKVMVNTAGYGWLWRTKLLTREVAKAIGKLCFVVQNNTILGRWWNFGIPALRYYELLRDMIILVKNKLENANEYSIKMH